MRLIKTVLLGLAVGLALGGGWIAYKWRAHTDLAAYRTWLLPQQPPRTNSLRVTFLGVSTLLFDDGETAILTDGFFTRPAIGQVLFKKIAPDRELIASLLKRGGVTRLAAVIVCHSHYDHAMDAPEVAYQTGAVLVGSESTANIARGWGLPEARIRVPPAQGSMSFGKFRITLVPTGHVPPGYPGGEITQPLVSPARAIDYRVGTVYTVVIEHEGKSLLVNASAGVTPGALAGRYIDLVFLGIGTLGKRNLSYMQDYWREVVEATGARRVIPIHWDNFARPLNLPLQPLPELIDDFDATMRFLIDKGTASKVEVKLMQAWQVLEPF